MEKFIELFAGVVEENPADITPESELSSFPAWDSLGLVTFLAVTDQEYKKQISAQQVRDAKTVSDLYSLVAG